MHVFGKFTKKQCDIYAVFVMLTFFNELQIKRVEPSFLTKIYIFETLRYKKN